MPTRGASRRLRSTAQTLVCLLVLCCALSGLSFGQEPVLTSPAPPQTRTLVPLEQALDTRGDLSLQNTTIQKALFTIGATWNVNIVVGKEVEGTVSCIYTQAPLREVLDAILLANGYSYRAVGQSLVVQKTQEVGSANPLFESAAIPITHSDLQEVVEGARLLLSSQGQLQSMESANSILVVDFADRVDSIRKFVEQMDAAASQSTGGIPSESYKRLQVAYFHTQYIPVDNTKPALTAVLSSTGKLATMPAENRLVVVDYPSNIDMAKRVLEKIDRPRPQVRITGLIYDISLQDVEQLGINWNQNVKGNDVNAEGVPNQELKLDTQTLAPFNVGSSGGAVTVKSFTSNFDIRAVILALQNAKDARLLADPNVTVEENEMAELASVQEIPFQQITQSELGGQIGTTAFKPVGITLNVTPQIASDGTVKMIVNQEFSRVAGFTETDDQPIIDARIATTTVRVANKRTVVIGGLRQRTDTGDFNGIPFLKDVRVIGPLFRARDTNVRESELLVFLQPEIVDYDQIMSAREYMAAETLDTRLNGIPLAEGMPNNANGEPCHEPIPFPSIESEGIEQIPAEDAIPEQVDLTSQHAPLRPSFDERYRTTGDSAPLRQSISEKERAAAKTSVWKRMFKK